MKLHAVTWAEIPSIRSGQTFWRTITNYDPHTQGITIQVIPYTTLGTRRFFERRKGVRIHAFQPQRSWILGHTPHPLVSTEHPRNKAGASPFIFAVYATDLVGHTPTVRTFRKKVHADRFADAVAALDVGYPGVRETLEAATREAEYLTPSLMRTGYSLARAYHPQIVGA